MKLAFISDIHGNAIALEAVLADIAARKVDKVFVLGDISFRGPEPKRALDLVRSLDCDVVKGNADEWVVRGIKAGEVPDQALSMMTREREWTYARLDAKDIDYLKKLPTELKLEVNGTRIHAFHATPHSLFDIVQPFDPEETMVNKLMPAKADVYIYAHIHKPYIKYIDGKCLINIGSVGLPFDGLNKSSYALVDIDEGHMQTSIVRVEYGVDQVVNQYLESDYPNAAFMAEVISKGAI